MQLTFLGTSAGEFYPAMWCECPKCAYARQHGGRNLRRHSCALLDDDVMIDLPAHAFLTAQEMGLNLRKITTLLVTHNHRDHFDPLNIATRILPSRDGMWYDIPQAVDEAAMDQWIGPRFTPLPELRIVCPMSVVEACRHGNVHIGGFDEKNAEGNTKELDIRFCVPEPGKAYQLEDQGLRVTAVVSHHATPGSVYNYIIERDGKTLLYACDCGGYDEDMLAVIRRFRYDLVVMEGTFGLMANENPGHMNLKKDRDMLAYFDRHRLWKNEPRFVLSHIAPHNTPPYDEYRKTVEAAGMILAYDGMKISF